MEKPGMRISRRGGRWLGLPLSLILLPFWMQGCDSGSLNVNDLGTWDFSGFVIDGSTKQPLPGAFILYTDKDGTEQKAQTGASGAFQIKSLPFGDRNFKIGLAADTSLPAYTEKLLVISALNESRSVEGLVANVSVVVSLFPRTGAVSGSLRARVPVSGKEVTAAGVQLKLAYNDTALNNASPILFQTVTDAKGRFSFEHLPMAPGATVTINNYTLNGTLYGLDPVAIPKLFDKGTLDLGPLSLAAKDSAATGIELVKSNVLSDDGFGLPSVPVDQSLYYVLPAAPEPGTLAVTLSSGAGVANVGLRVRGDTLFVDPVGNLPFDTLVTVTVSGLDTAGNHILYEFDGNRRFRTEKGVYAVESNAWNRVGVPSRAFMPEDTLWVKFSQDLDPDVGKITWLKSEAKNAIIGSGAQANASAWVKRDTLFVRPDQRLAVDYGETMGFKIIVLSKDGKSSDSTDIVAQVVADAYYVSATNAKDALGKMRDDFGPMDSVYVVSSSPIEEVRGLSPIPGKAAPPDLFLDNVSLRGRDTIVYKPSLYLKTDSTYGIDFDVLFADKTFRRHVLPVVWKTMGSLRVLSVDNRKDGLFRAFKAIGDSLTVVFSAPIDTSASSTVPFHVNMVDVNGTSLRTKVDWLKDMRTAVIRNLDTLPTADCDASPAYTEDAADTRAVNSVTFDLITTKGEKVFGFKPSNQRIELHTEKGLCVTDANFLNAHDRRTSVKRTETPLAEFDRKAAIELAFSRELDTAAIRKDTLNAYFQLRTATDTVLTDLAFSADAKTATLTPKQALTASTNYQIRIKDVPAKGIAGAAPINAHGGTFSGAAINNTLLDAPLRTGNQP